MTQAEGMTARADRIEPREIELTGRRLGEKGHATAGGSGWVGSLKLQRR
jgi:hypothetical protein